jgi:pyrimidine deaminase RibD-like protein
MTKLNDDEMYRELFDAKKNAYNDSHDIKIHGIPVELYIQDSSQPVVSLGEYSIKNNKWLKIPSKRRANFDQTATARKYEKILAVIERALKTHKLDRVQNVLKTIKRYRQAGLDKGGEFGPENLAYKALRSQGYITALYKLRDELHSKELSIEGMYAENSKLNKPTPTIEQLVIKYKVPKQDILIQLDKGIKVELEHTKDRSIAREIALDHINEDPHYYNKLAKANIKESTDSEIHNYHKLDRILAKLCEMVVKGQSSDKDYGMVGACVLDPDNKIVAGLNSPGAKGKRVHAERVAIEKYEQKYGEVPEGSIVITTLSPCNESDDETAENRDGESCAAYINAKGIEKVYCGYIDPTQDNDIRNFNLMETSDQDIRKECKSFADTFLKQDIHEAFDQPYPFEWEESDSGDIDALTTLPDGTYLSIMFEHTTPYEVHVSFFRNNSQEVTGEGDSQRIFSTVLAAIQEFLKKEQPANMSFSASKEVESGQNNMSRTKLYNRLIQRYANAWGYKFHSFDHGDIVEYELSKINKTVAEASGYIPSEKQKNDPRFKTALTVDVKPDSIKKNAKAFSWLTSRAGIPPTLNPSGKV